MTSSFKNVQQGAGANGGGGGLLGGLDAHDAVGGWRDGHEAAEGVLDRLEPVVAVDAEQVRTGKLQGHTGWCKKIYPCLNYPP